MGHWENVKNLPSNMRRHREERRRLLTRGERIVAGAFILGPSLFTVAGIVLLLSVHGAAHAIGIALLILGLLMMTVPISPFLRTRVRRREADDTPKP
jgi:hypothetical protein